MSVFVSKNCADNVRSTLEAKNDSKRRARDLSKQTSGLEYIDG